MASDLIAQPMREMLLVHALVTAMKRAGINTVTIDIGDEPQENVEIRLGGDVAVFKLVDLARVEQAKAEGQSVIEFPRMDGEEMMPFDPQEEGDA